MRPEFTFESGDKYTGHWIKATNTKQGYGVLVWADGSRYEGQFKNDKINGRGKVTFSNGDKFNFLDELQYLTLWFFRKCCF